MWLKLCLSVLLLIISDVYSYRLNDSEYARMPPLYHMDDYGRCLSQEDGLYCVLNITLTANPENDLMRMIKKYSQDKAIHYDHSYLNHGICVKQRCKSFISEIDEENTDDLARALERCFNKPYREEYGFETNISIFYCNRPNESRKIDSGDWIFGVVMAIMAMLNITATIYDWLLRRKLDKNKNKTTGNQFLLSFSIQQNWQRLVSMEPSDPRFEIFTGIHGLRSILTFLMVIAHTMFLMGCGFIDNPHDFEKTYDNLLYYFIFNGMMLVQTYFLISGCLLVFTVSVNSETKPISLSKMPMVLFYRWSRLTGSLAVVLAFMTTWYRHLGSGPLWDFHVTPIVGDCRQYWWSHILFVNNYMEGNRACLIQTWHIAAEFQMFIIGLAIYLVTRSYARQLCIFLMFLVGCVAPALHVWFQDHDGVLMLYPELYRTFVGETFRKMHLRFHNNLACYAIGMQLGFLIYNTQTKKIDFSKHKKLGYIMWAVFPVIVFIYLSGGVFYIEGEKSPVLLRMVYAATHRALLGACIAYAIFGLAFKFEGSVCGFMEWKGWKVTSRLAYGVYLVHVSIIHYLQGTKYQLGHVAFFNATIHHLGIVWLSYVIAVPLFLLVEVPLNRCFKILLQKEEKIDAKKDE